MGEAPAFQQNQPQGFQQQPPGYPPPYQPYPPQPYPSQPYPPQPISQYNLYYQQQQQQQQQGYNANPYGVPYGSQSVGVAYKKICNPCCCCRRGNCNLRRNCIVIAIFLIIAGVGQVLITYDQWKVFCSENSRGSGVYGRLFERQGGYEPSYQYSTCKSLPIVWVVKIFNAILVGLYFVPGAFLLVAVFVPGQGWAALVTGILMSLNTVMTLTNAILQLVAGVSYGISFGQPASPGILGAFFPVGLNIWFTVCAFQFWKQIKAGVDKYPVEGPPAQFIPPPTPTGYGYGPQPTLAPSAATLPPPPPGYNAGRPT